MIWLWRILLSLGFSLALLVYWLVATSAGARWSVELLETLLPDLELELQGGTLTGGLAISTLRYNAPVVEVTIHDLSLRLKPLLLLGGVLAAPEVSAGEVVLQLVDSGRPPSGKGLPTVSLPITLVVGRADISHFELITRGGTSVVASIQTALRWRDTWIETTDATLHALGHRIDTDLAIQLQGNYRVDADLVLRSETQSWTLLGEASGSLQELLVMGIYQGFAPLSFTGGVRLLDKNLPLWLEATSDPGAELMVAGEPLPLSKAKWLLSGDLSLIEGQLQAELEHQQLGPVTLQIPMSWQDRKLHIEDGHLLSEHGDVAADCDFDTRVARWRCRGTVDALSAKPWLEAPAVSVSTPLAIDGAWNGQQPVLSVRAPGLSGWIDQQPLTGELAIESADWQQWQLNRFTVKAGANRLTMAGIVGDELDLQLRLAVGNLAQLSGSGAGAINGRLKLTGEKAAPVLNGRLSGSGLQWGELGVDRFSGHVELQASGESRLDSRLILSGLRYGEQRLGVLNMTLDGSRTQPRLSIDLSGGDHQVAVGCRGEQGSYWRVKCARLEGKLAILGNRHLFALEQPLLLEWHPQTAVLNLAPTCLRMAPASLCLPQPARLGSGRVDGVALKLRRLPLQWWYGALPATITALPGSYLDADLEVASLSPLQARLTSVVEEVRWEWRGEGGIYPASMEEIRLRLELDDSYALLVGQASSEVLGGMQLHLTVDDPRGQQNLDGRILISDLQLRAFSWLSESIQRLRGSVNGTVKIAGNAAAPNLTGKLVLREGLLKDLSLPYPLEDVQADISLNQDQADVVGSFQLNEGLGSVKGKVRWQDSEPRWRVNAALETQSLSLPILERSVVTLAANLELGMQPGLIDLNGNITVDNADIRLVSLPPETIGTSADTEIIGTESASVWQFRSDLSIDLGERLRFRGFGVDMTLAGGLRLRNSRRYRNDVTGEVKVARGRFRAYGQDLDIRNGRLIFLGLANNPDLKLEAIRESRDRTIVGGLRVTGTLQEPVGEFFAEPAMTDTDVAYFLLTGRLPPEPGQKDTTSGGALINLGLVRTNESAARLASKLGIEGFQISTADGETGLETHVSGYLSEDLYVSYGTGFEERSASLTMQYYITPSIVLEAVGGFTSALDIIYTFRID